MRKSLLSQIYFLSGNIQAWNEEVALALSIPDPNIHQSRGCHFCVLQRGSNERSMDGKDFFFYIYLFILIYY